jgi:hypothetical protein
MFSFTPRWMMDPDIERNGYEYKQKFIYTGDDHDNDDNEDDDNYFNDLICKYKKIHIYTDDDNDNYDDYEDYDVNDDDDK